MITKSMQKKLNYLNLARQDAIQIISSHSTDSCHMLQMWHRINTTMSTGAGKILGLEKLKFNSSLSYVKSLGSLFFFYDFDFVDDNFVLTVIDTTSYKSQT